MELDVAALPRLSLGGTLRRVRCAGRVLPMEPVAAQEGPDAGHTLARHGNSLAEDIARLRREPWVGSSGSFTNHAVMENAVARALVANSCDILSWLGQAGPRQPLIREVAFDAVVGHNVTREDLDSGRPSRPCDGLRFVLFADAGRPTGYQVRTSYPVVTPPAPVALPAHRLRDYERAGAGTTLGSHCGSTQLVDVLTAHPNKRTAARFLSADHAERAVAEALHHWSAEIADWRAGTDNSLVRAYCGHSPVGETLQSAEAQAGETTPVPTPVILMRLQRDDRFAEGFAVAEAFPVRGY